MGFLGNVYLDQHFGSVFERDKHSIDKPIKMPIYMLVGSNLGNVYLTQSFGSVFERDKHSPDKLIKIPMRQSNLQ
jgi:hypothetical protein